MTTPQKSSQSFGLIPPKLNTKSKNKHLAHLALFPNHPNLQTQMGPHAMALGSSLLPGLWPSNPGAGAPGAARCGLRRVRRAGGGARGGGAVSGGQCRLTVEQAQDDQKENTSEKTTCFFLTYDLGPSFSEMFLFLVFGSQNGFCCRTWCSNKSRSPRSYEAFTLPNGLRVLLVEER